MKVKNVTSILFSKFSLVFKMMVFLLILTFVLAILGSAFFLPILKGLRKDLQDLHVISVVTDYIKAILKGENSAETYNVLINTFHEISELSKKWDNNIIASVVILVFIIFLFAVFYYMAYYTVGDILYAFMSSNSKYGFTSNYVYNLKKSFSFAIIYAPVIILYYSLSFIAGLALSLWIGKSSAMIGLQVFLFLAFAVLALRRTLFVYWIPNMVIDGKSTIVALNTNFRQLKGKFLRIFGEYYVVYLSFVVLSFLVSIFTAGVGIIFVYVISWLVMQIMDNVEFYNLKGKKYYIDEQTVVDPKMKYKDAVIEDDNFSL